MIIRREIFRRNGSGAQLDLAGELALPVVIHSRDAAEDTVDILLEYFENGESERAGKDGSAGRIPAREFSLLFIFKGNGRDTYEDRNVLWNRRSSYI